MNDFLQSLRGGQKDKRTPKTRRGVDNNSNPHYNQSPYPGGYQNPRGGNVKRVTRSNSPAKYPVQDMDISMTNDDFAERALDVLDGFLKNQERLVDIQQRRIIIEERKADALEEIVEHFRSTALAGEQSQSYSDLDSGGALDAYPVEPGMAAKSGLEKEISANEDFLPHEDPLPHKDMQDMRRNVGQQENEGVIKPPSSPYEDDLPEKDPPAAPSEDLFFQESEIPSREKSVPEKRAFFKRTDRSNAEARKKKSPATVKKHINKEVKVIKRPRADKQKSIQTPSKPQTTVTPSPDGVLPREEVMKIIESMREKGATFDQVAKYLVEIKQPTFSGRGEWHAQTVHRLCNRKK